MNFMLDNNTRFFQYLECSVPEMVKDVCLYGTGQLPKFGEDLFKTNFNNLWLIPTAEVPLTNFHREDIMYTMKKNLNLLYKVLQFYMVILILIKFSLHILSFYLVLDMNHLDGQ